MVSRSDNFRFLSSIEEISCDDWNNCAGLDHPFTRYEFFYALEKSKSAISSTGWKPFHYIETNTKGDLIAICPLYIKRETSGTFPYP